jgi:outer membrane lipoprotein SlyB
MRRYSACLLALGLLGCSSHPEPIVDTKGVNMAQYQRDLEECQQYAKQVNPAEGVARGAAGGAAVGAAIGAIGGNAGHGAAIGAISGGASSGVKGDRERQEVVKRCLAGRGYKVLN